MHSLLSETLQQRKIPIKSWKKLNNLNFLCKWFSKFSLAILETSFLWKILNNKDCHRANHLNYLAKMITFEDIISKMWENFFGYRNIRKLEALSEHTRQKYVRRVVATYYLWGTKARYCPASTYNSSYYSSCNMMCWSLLVMSSSGNKKKPIRMKWQKFFTGQGFK